MPLDRSDRPWMPVHTGAKNRVRMTWSARTTARSQERKDGVAVDPREKWGTWPATQADVLAMLKAGVDPAEIAAMLEGSS